MKKKYYGLFIYHGQEYVIRFKIKGSLRYREKDRCFVDDHYYVRSIADVICMAAFDSCAANIHNLGFSCLISHETFVLYRSRNIPRWPEENEIIDWD